MLAEGRTARSRSLTRGALLLLVAILLITLILPAARGDEPSQVTNADSSRTVTWVMQTPQNLTNQSVTFAGGQAILPWENQTLTWSRASQFQANGTLAPGMVANATGLEMFANESNQVANPTFSTAASWSFRNGTSNNATSLWDEPLGAGELTSSWGGDQVLWEPMDNVAAHWLAMPNSFVAQNTSNPPPRQGTGTMGVAALSLSTASIGAVNSSLTPVNWSGYDRLVLWIYMNVSLAASFNFTAHAGPSGPLVTTTARPLAAQQGWQQVVVDLNQLGNSSVRSGLYQLGLRFNALTSFPIDTWFNIDDVRLGKARTFNETATITQTIVKSIPTTPLPGSARLSFDWFLGNDSNPGAFLPSVSLRPVGSPVFVPLVTSGPPGAWHVFTEDASAETSAVAAYNLTFALQVTANTTAAFDVELLIDNVTLVFPDVTNGTFLSSVLTPGVASQYRDLGWSGPDITGTSVTVGIRTGNNSAPESASWSRWDLVSTKGPVPLDVPGATHFQIRVDLNTTNASVSPIVQGLTLSMQHRASSGTLTSDYFMAETDFLRWRSFNANQSLGNGTTIEFWVGNGGSWTNVTAPGTLSSYGGGPRIRWRAVFSTMDGLKTPTLSNVTLIYEFLGPPASAVVTVSGSAVHVGTILNLTSGQTLSFGVLVYDSGSHLIPSTTYGQVWGLSNASGGSLSQNGMFTAGSLGLYEIQVTINEPGTNTFLHASIWVSISAPFSIWDAWPFMAVGIAALLGFAIYELAVRRLFSIDDVFLIGKDGRLMSHNTRRMLADRDEDILSGMLTAVNSFVRDSWREENSHVRRFVIGGKTTVVERGEHIFLAAVYSGRVPGWASRDMRALVDDLETYFGKDFAAWSGSPEDLQSLREVMRRFASRVRYSRRRVWKGIAV